MEIYGMNYCSPLSSVLCTSWTYPLLPPFCPKMQDVSILIPLWNWMGKEQSVCMYLLLTHIVLSIFQEKERGNTT